MKIKTIKGEIVNKNECRKIEGEYYKVGDRKIKNSGDVYEINERFYKDNTGYIIFDNYTKQYEIFSSTIHLKGIINIKEDKSFDIGYFQKNDLMCKVKSENNIYNCINYQILENSNYIVNRINNIYYHKNNIKLLSTLNYPDTDLEYKRRLNYNINKNVIKDVKKNYEINKHILKKYDFTKNLSTYLKGLTFGAEFETIAGTIPHKYSTSNCLAPLRDGSILGLEYVTLPLQGKEGLDNLLNANKLINDYTTVNDNCSFHLHIGNIPRTESFILAFFKTFSLIQDEFFQMFPLYKRINGGFKRKNYTKPLPSVEILSKMDKKITKDNIKENFDLIFTYLSGGYSYSEFGSDLQCVHEHPNDPNNDRKWNVNSRYHCVNLIPLIFGNKQTIEFRIHTPIKDPNKTIMFLLLCSKIINFVKKYENDILSGNKIIHSLADIIIHCSTDYSNENILNSYVIDYVNARKKFTKSCFRNNNFNYKETEFIYKNFMSVNFVNGYGLGFLKNKKNSFITKDKKIEVQEALNRRIRARETNSSLNQFLRETLGSTRSFNYGRVETETTRQPESVPEQPLTFNEVSS